MQETETLISGSNFPSSKNEKKNTFKTFFVFLYFRKLNFLVTSLKSFYVSRGNLQILKIKNFTFFLFAYRKTFKHKGKRKKVSYTFPYKEGNLEKKITFFLFAYRKPFKHKRKRKKVSCTFPYKEGSLKKKHNKAFFSHFITFLSLLNQFYFFHLLRDFCNVHDNVVAF